MSFTVKFSSEIVRIIECADTEGQIKFSVDQGSHGDKSLCLEHHPRDWPRDQRYTEAFDSAKRFLISCGYQVEVYGE